MIQRLWGRSENISIPFEWCLPPPPSSLSSTSSPSASPSSGWVFPTARLIKVGSSLYAGWLHCTRKVQWCWCFLHQSCTRMVYAGLHCARKVRPLVLYGGFQVIPPERCQQQRWRRGILHQGSAGLAPERCWFTNSGTNADNIYCVANFTIRPLVHSNCYNTAPGAE